MYKFKHANEKCTNRAPHIFYINSNGKARINQGCCNDWLCPRCGEIRAKTEYDRMLFGAMVLEKEGHDLFFMTLTCRGREISLEEAEEKYFKWTTKLLNSMRNQCKRSNGFWCYVQVTERQKRGHPHSHFIITYKPSDAFLTLDRNGREVLISRWFSRQNQKSGLGRYHEITKVKSAARVARYIAKYLFKSALTTKWRKGWRRVRYSRNFPKVEKPPTQEGFPLLHIEDWYRIKEMNMLVKTSSPQVVKDAEIRLMDFVKLD